MQPGCGSRTRKTGHSGAKEEARPVKRRVDKGRRKGQGRNMQNPQEERSQEEG